MAEYRLRILHISDLHLDGEMSNPGGWRRRRVLGAEWEKNLASIISEGPLDLICFTGDLVQSGKADEYAALTSFVEHLLARTGMARDRLFVVPGNHDIDRSIAKSAWRRLRALDENDAEALSRWMAGGRGPSRLTTRCPEDILRRQGAYRTWVREGLLRPELLPSASQHPRLGYRIPLRLPGYPFDVHVIGLDSAWLAGDDNDARKLRLTRDQIGFLADDLRGFRLALVHHPLDELADGDACRDLLAERVDLLLRGHLHDTRLRLWSEPDRHLREVATGCLYQSDTYANGCTVLELTLDDEGRPCRPCRFWFRGWAERGFWTDEDKLYRDSRGGRLTWPAEVPPPPLPRCPTDRFVGRSRELQQLVEALLPATVPLRPVAVMALQGMPGVGKSFLVDRFAYLHREHFPGGYHVLALEPDGAPSVDTLGGRLARLVGQRTWGSTDAWGELVARLRSPAALVHLENVDSEGLVAGVVDLVHRLPGCALVISGRSRRFGRQPPFQLLEVQPLDEPTALEQLVAVLGPATDAATMATRRRLTRALGNLPLALHLAAGYIEDGHSVEGFLDLLSARGLTLEPASLDDPLYRLDRARAVLSTTFELSLDLLRRRLGPHCATGLAAFAVLGHAPGTGVRCSLGAAMAGLPEGTFEMLMVEATRLSLASGSAASGWSIHPLLAELLRGKSCDDEWLDRMTDWFVARLPKGSEDQQGSRWNEIHSEHAALERWLDIVPTRHMTRVVQEGAWFAMNSGPYRTWMNFCDRVLASSADPEVRSHVLLVLCHVSRMAGAPKRAREAAEAKLHLDQERGAEREAAFASFMLADILYLHGDLEAALQILIEKVLPVLERLNEQRELAVARAKVAEIRQIRGDLDGALQILQNDLVPAFERLGDPHARAVALGKIADILKMKGDLAKALRIYSEEELPVYKRHGDLHALAMTHGKIADILVQYGKLSEARHTLIHDVLPVIERLGDVRARAIFLGKVGDIAKASGDLDEELRIRQEEELPVYEGLGDIRSWAITRRQIAEIQMARGFFEEAALILKREVLPVLEKLGDTQEGALTREKLHTCQVWPLQSQSPESRGSIRQKRDTHES